MRIRRAWRIRFQVRGRMSSPIATATIASMKRNPVSVRLIAPTMTR